MQGIEFPDRQMPKFIGFTPSFDDNELVEAPEGLASTYASAVAGILAAIEYQDAEGSLSRRRVSMRRLSIQAEQPVLYAICMECDGFRSFRLDRVQCFITQFGEVLEPSKYWGELGIDPEAECRAHVEAKDRFMILGPYLNLLCALADSDGERHRVEVEQIMDILELALEDRGEFLNDDELRWLRYRVENTFPARHTVNEAMDDLFGSKGGTRQAPFMRSALAGMRKVAEADGKLAPEEVRLFQDLEGMIAKRESVA